MEFTHIIDKIQKERVIVYSHENNPLVDSIRSLVENCSNDFVGYKDNERVMLSLNDVVCFTLEKGKLFAITDDKKYEMKQRLYQIEEKLDLRFIKINQSTLANIGKIKKFDVSIGGSLLVVFKNGYKDYVSRRQLKNVKERIGF